MVAVTEFLYIISAALFVLALRWMSSPETARRAVVAAVTAMIVAVGGTLLHPEIVTYKWIAIAAIAGAVVGFPLSRVPLTAVPERTGLSQSFGGLAAALVGTAKYYLWLHEGGLNSFRMSVVAGEVILGCLTCTGGLMAAGKLAEYVTTRSLRVAWRAVADQRHPRHSDTAAGVDQSPCKTPHPERCRSRSSRLYGRLCLCLGTAAGADLPAPNGRSSHSSRRWSEVPGTDHPCI